jgi:hypothetical protein
VLNHMVGGADWFAGPARGEEVPLPNWSAMPDCLGADPAHSYRAAADRAHHCCILGSCVGSAYIRGQP